MDDAFSLFDAWQDCLYGADPAISQASNDKNQRVIYEESILMTLLGPDYMQLIS